jgi:hypothetical protein
MGSRGIAIPFLTSELNSDEWSDSCPDPIEHTLHGLSPRANYTDRATAACRRSDCQLLRIKGCHAVSVTDPYGRFLGFLDRSSYFSIK